MRLHDLGRAGEGRLPGVRADHVQKGGPGAKKPFCINPACSNFLPEDKRGYPRYAAKKDGDTEPPAAEEEKPAAKKTASKTAKASPAKKAAAAKKTTAKKPAAKKTEEEG